MERFNYLFENNPLPMWLYDTATLRFLDVNSTAIAVYGYTKDEFLGMTLKDIRPESEWDKLEKDVRETTDVFNPGSRWIHRKKNGEIINVDISSYKVEYKDIDVRLVVVKDITEQVNIEKKLIESESRFRELFENSSSMFLIIDSDTGKIENVNKAAELFYGWSLVQFTQLYIWQINQYPKEQVLHLLKKVVKEKKGHFNFTHKTAFGELKEVEIYAGALKSGGRDLIFSIIVDASDKKKALSEVNKLSLAINQSNASVIITDIHGNIEYVNPAFTQSTGYSKEEVIGKNPRFLKSGIQDNHFYRKLWETITTGGNWRGDIANKRKNGELIWEKTEISPLKDANGKIVNFVAVKEDITKEKRLISNLIEAKSRAEKSDALKSRFISSISHEIKTPLNSIIGFSDLILSEETSESIKEYATIIKRAGNYLDGILDSILNFKLANTERSIVNEDLYDVNIVLNECLKKVKDEAIVYGKNKLEIELEPLQEKSFSVKYKFDKRILTSIINTLTNNALKFTSEGKIIIGCKIGEDNKSGISKLLFYVKDTGIGISPEFHEAIFEPFRQADDSLRRQFGGVGLSLSVAKKFSELIGGSLWVESQLNKGASFYLLIDVNNYDQSTEKNISNKNDKASDKDIKEISPTIIISSDKSILTDIPSFTSDFAHNFNLDPLYTKVIFTTLEKEDSDNIINTITRDKISILYVDFRINSTYMSDIVEKLKKIKPSLKVIAITKEDDMDAKQLSLEAGCDDYISLYVI